MTGGVAQVGGVARARAPGPRPEPEPEPDTASRRRACGATQLLLAVRPVTSCLQCAWEARGASCHLPSCSLRILLPFPEAATSPTPAVRGSCPFQDNFLKVFIPLRNTSFPPFL